MMKEPLNGWTHIEFNDSRPKKNPAEIEKFVAELEGKNEKGNAARGAIEALNGEGDVDDEEEEEEEGEEGEEEEEEEEEVEEDPKANDKDEIKEDLEEDEDPL